MERHLSFDSSSSDESEEVEEREPSVDVPADLQRSLLPMDSNNQPLVNPSQLQELMNAPSQSDARNLTLVYCPQFKSETVNLKESTYIGKQHVACQQEGSQAPSTSEEPGKEQHDPETIPKQLLGGQSQSEKERQENAEETGQNAAIQKVIEYQNKYRDDDLASTGARFPTELAPNVHPKIYRVALYDGSCFYKDEVYRPSTHRVENKGFNVGSQIEFSEMLQEAKRVRYIGLIGLPGSGKTTCSKRLAKSEQWVVFYLKFMDINYGHDLITLKQLLLDYAYTSLSKEIKSAAFRWVKRNHNKIVIVMDGLDQASWTFTENFPNYDLDSPQPVSNLVANIFNKHFLPEATIIVTSRPHSLLKIPQKLRPKAVYLLQDFSRDDMKTLFSSYAGELAGQLWRNLTTSAPQLVSMCLCPLMLVLCVSTLLQSHSQVGELSTMTRIFSRVLDNLRRSGHVMGQKDLKTIVAPLTKLAYEATKGGKVVITKQQLKKNGLDIYSSQDLVILWHGHPGMSCNLFEGDEKFYFCHKSFQEYFTALHVSSKMSLEDFKKMFDFFFEYQWSMVRKFVCGLVLDNILDEDTTTRRDAATSESSQRQSLPKMVTWFTSSVKKIIDRSSYSSADTETKRSVLLKKLAEKMKEIAEKMETSIYVDQTVQQQLLVDLCLDVREGNSSDVTSEVTKHFPGKLTMKRYKFIASTAHALSYVISQITCKIVTLDLFGCDLDSETFNHFVEAIKSMNGTIGNLDIRVNQLTEVEQICSILHKVDDSLSMDGCFSGQSISMKNRSASSDEKEKLQSVMNSLHDSTLLIEVNEPEDGDTEIIQRET